MFENTDQLNDNNVMDLVSKFERMQAQGQCQYFDVDDFESLTDYYLEEFNISQALNVIKLGLKIHPQSPSLLLKKAQLLTYSNKTKRR